MRRNYFIFLIVALVLSGCATKTAYVNTANTPEQIQKDKGECDSLVNASDFKDASLKQNKFNQCMESKGYKIVPEDEALRIKGFKEAWINPAGNLKAYEVIFIEKVDVSQAKINETKLPSAKVSEEDLNNLGKEMSARFAKTLSNLMPATTEEKEISGRKALRLSLKLTEVGQSDVLLNAASEAIPVEFVDISSHGLLTFEGIITDFSSGQKLIIIQDKAQEDKNASLAGLENFERWKHAHNIIDYWADHLAVLLAKERGQEYKSRLGFKLVDF